MEDYVVTTKYDGFPRRCYETRCVKCSKNFWVPRHVLGKRKFCSPECRAEGSKKKRISFTCPHCYKKFDRTKGRIKTKSGYLFCSRDCKDAAQSVDGVIGFAPSHYKDGAWVYRSRAFRAFGKRCRCGYCVDERMLDVHHKDGDRQNNVLENLEVLCVWCHALETRKMEPHNWNGNLG